MGQGMHSLLISPALPVIMLTISRSLQSESDSINSTQSRTTRSFLAATRRESGTDYYIELQMVASGRGYNEYNNNNKLHYIHLCSLKDMFCE